MLGVPEAESRPIHAEEIRECLQEYPGGEVRFEKPFPARIDASGFAMDQSLAWSRSLRVGGRTTHKEAGSIKKLAAETVSRVTKGSVEDLPLLSYYGTGRLWLEPRENSQIKDSKSLLSQARISRLDGYKNRFDPRLSVRELVRWFAQRA